MRQSFLIAIAFILISPTLSQQVLTNIPFECKGQKDGFWRDLRYCDVFHACVAGEQKRSYGCPQVGERFYFDDNTQKCEFAYNNTGGCQANQYYTPVTNATAVPGSQLTTQGRLNTFYFRNLFLDHEAPTEPWKIFIQSRDQFSCSGRQDAFYASRWCNVFYRCYAGVSNAFLCPLQRGGGRLWWIQHGLSQSVPESAAACAFPCETGRQCSSAGGILVENGNQISESQQEAEVAYRQSVCTNQTSQTNQFGTGQTGAGNQGGSLSTGTGNQGSSVNTGTGNQGSSVNTGTGNQGGSLSTGTGNQGGSSGTGTGNQGGSSGTGATFTVNSDVSCAGQTDGTFLAGPFCNVFHQCSSGKRFDIRCARANNVPYDLWWNQQTQLCDWPCRVQCNKPLFASSSSAQQVLVTA